MKTPYSLKAVVLLTAAVTLAACTKPPVNQDAPPQGMQAMPVTVMAPEKRTVTEWNEFTGRFQPSQRVEIRARVSGYLDKIEFKDGENVDKGDVLFVIDQRPFKIALNSAQSQYDLALHRFERAKALHDKQAVSKDSYEQRQQEMQTTLAALEEAKLNLEFTEIRAPISGRISRKLVDEGNLIEGGNNATVLTTIVSVKPIHFYFEGSENDLLKHTRLNGEVRGRDQVPLPLPAYVKLQDEAAFEHKGQIDFVDNEFNMDTGTIQARAKFENDNGFLEAGYFGRLRIAPQAPYEATVVPDHLIGTEQTRKYVYVIGENGMATRTYVTLGALEDDGMRIIKSGLNEGDQVITGNLNMIRPGVPVMAQAPMPAEQAAAQEAEVH